MLSLAAFLAFKRTKLQEHKTNCHSRQNSHLTSSQKPASPQRSRNANEGKSQSPQNGADTVKQGSNGIPRVQEPTGMTESVVDTEFIGEHPNQTSRGEKYYESYKKYNGAGNKKIRL